MSDRGRPNFGFGFGAECGQMGTFGGRSVSAESSRAIFGALSVSACVLQLVNSVVVENRVQSLSCGGRECARRRKSLASLCTDRLCQDNRGSWLRCLRLHLVGLLRQAGINDALHGSQGGGKCERPRHYRLSVSVFGRNSRFTFGGKYGFCRMCYVTFGLLSASAESKTSAFGRPLV